VDRLTRRQLKSDRFAEEVEHTLEYAAEHRRQLIIYGSVALAVVLALAGFWYYRSAQHEKRQELLAQAMEVLQLPVGPAPAGIRSFPTEAEKNKELTKKLNEILSQYPGSTEAVVAASYLGNIAVSEGKYQEAEKQFTYMADKGDPNLASLGKFMLSQVYFSSGKTAEAEKLLRALMDKPTLFVSKEQATITLARGIADSRPEEARKLLQPLVTSSESAVSQAAITAMAEVPKSAP